MQLLVYASRGLVYGDKKLRRQGLVRLTLHNWTLTDQAAADVSPNRLMAFYPLLR